MAAAPHVGQPRWEEALTHPAQALRTRARRIADLIAELEKDIAEQSEDLRLEARLTEQLAEVRARLGIGTQPPARMVHCLDCHKPFDSRGYATHRRMHEKTRRSGEAMPPAG